MTAPTDYLLPTAQGAAKLAQVMAQGGSLQLTHVAFGDGGGSVPAHTEASTQLVNEVHRRGITSVIVSPTNPDCLEVETVLPPNVGGWYIREIGIYDTDGVLIAVGVLAPSYKTTLDNGSTRETRYRLLLQIGAAASVTLVMDPSVVFVTRSYVDALVAAHAASRNHPDASYAQKGFSRFATPVETRAKTLNNAGVTPEGLATLNATEDEAGLVEFATPAEAKNPAIKNRGVTPEGVHTALSARQADLLPYLYYLGNA